MLTTVGLMIVGSVREITPPAPAVLILRQITMMRGTLLMTVAVPTFFMVPAMP